MLSQLLKNVFLQCLMHCKNEITIIKKILSNVLLPVSTDLQKVVNQKIEFIIINEGMHSY